MKNKKNIVFLVVFLFYIISFVIGEKYIGSDILYASLPMVLVGSMVYGSVSAFIIIAANIPGSIALFYITGTPLRASVEMIDPFIFLLQCVVALIPFMVKKYTEKREIIEITKIQKRISALMDRLNEEREQNEKLQRELSDLRLEYERLRVDYSMKKDNDPLLDVYNREKTIREMNNAIKGEKNKGFIYVKTLKLKKINIEEGIYKADTFLRGIVGSLKRYSEDTGRIGNSEFIIIIDIKKIDKVYEEIKAVYGSDIISKKIIPDENSDIEKIFKDINKHEMRT